MIFLIIFLINTEPGGSANKQDQSSRSQLSSSITSSPSSTSTSNSLNNAFSPSPQKDTQQLSQPHIELQFNRVIEIVTSGPPSPYIVTEGPPDLRMQIFPSFENAGKVKDLIELLVKDQQQATPDFERDEKMFARAMKQQ